MRLPCTPLTSSGSTFEPFKLNDRVSETEALGCGATAIWNSNVVGDVISISSSAATSRLTSVPLVHRTVTRHQVIDVPSMDAALCNVEISRFTHRIRRQGEWGDCTKPSPRPTTSSDQLDLTSDAWGASIGALRHPPRAF